MKKSPESLHCSFTLPPEGGSAACCEQLTGQGDALLVSRLPLAVLVHCAALAAGLLAADEGRVVLGAKVILDHSAL